MRVCEESFWGICVFWEKYRLWFPIRITSSFVKKNWDKRFPHATKSYHLNNTNRNTKEGKRGWLQSCHPAGLEPKCSWFALLIFLRQDGAEPMNSSMGILHCASRALGSTYCKCKTEMRWGGKRQSFTLWLALGGTSGYHKILQFQVYMVEDIWMIWKLYPTIKTIPLLARLEDTSNITAVLADMLQLCYSCIRGCRLQLLCYSCIRGCQLLYA